MPQEGTIVEFTGYQQLSEGTEAILKEGEKVVIVKIIENEDETKCYNVRPILADGSIDKSRPGEQLFDDEFEETEPDEIPAIEEPEEVEEPEISDDYDEEEPAMEADSDFSHDPVVTSLIRSTNNLTELAYGLYVEHEELYYKLGGILLDIKQKKFHVEAGYPDDSNGFAEYVKDNVGPGKRTSYYLISVYKRLREGNLTAKDLQGIGWTKARLLKDIKDNDKLQEFIEKAKKLSRVELEDEIERMKHNGSGNKKERFSFSLTEDAAILVHQALDFAMTQSSSDKNKAFEMIITSYLIQEVGRTSVLNGEEKQDEKENIV